MGLILPVTLLKSTESLLMINFLLSKFVRGAVQSFYIYFRANEDRSEIRAKLPLHFGALFGAELIAENSFTNPQALGRDLQQLVLRQELDRLLKAEHPRRHQSERFV